VNHRPLVVHFGRMGDMVVLLTLIQALRQRFDTPVDVVCSGYWAKPMLERQPDVGTVYRIRSPKDAYWLARTQWRVVDELHRRAPGPTWICDEDRVTKSRVLLKRARIPAEFILEEHSCPFLPGEHVVDRWWRFAQMNPSGLPNASLELDARSTPGTTLVPPLVVAPEWRSEADNWLAQRGFGDQPLVLVQVGSKATTRWGRPYDKASNHKYWPEENWAQVIDGVAQLEPDAHILMMGVPNEARINDSILRQVRARKAHNVARELPMQRLLALQERALGMISVDTGPGHSAGALGCPLVVLFGVQDPAMWKPRSPTGAVKCLQGVVDGKRSMLGIRPDDVLNAWKSLRQEKRANAEAAGQPKRHADRKAGVADV
jgi:heptosyltransferase-2/heptosyltransferase-3